MACYSGWFANTDPFLLSLEFMLCHCLCLPVLDLTARKYFLVFSLWFLLFVEMPL